MRRLLLYAEVAALLAIAVVLNLHVIAAYCIGQTIGFFSQDDGR